MYPDEIIDKLNEELNALRAEVVYFYTSTVDLEHEWWFQDHLDELPLMEKIMSEHYGFSMRR